MITHAVLQSLDESGVVASIKETAAGLSSDAVGVVVAAAEVNDEEEIEEFKLRVRTEIDCPQLATRCVSRRPHSRID